MAWPWEKGKTTVTNVDLQPWVGGGNRDLYDLYGSEVATKLGKWAAGDGHWEARLGISVIECGGSTYVIAANDLFLIPNLQNELTEAGLDPEEIEAVMGRRQPTEE